MHILSNYVRDATATLNSVTVDSTGTNGRPQTYMLTVGDEKIDLSSKNLGPADVNLIAVWLQRPEVMAAPVEVVILDGNPIGFPLAVSLKPGAQTHKQIKVGAYVQVSERFGEVVKVFASAAIQVNWLDDGSLSSDKKSDSIKLNQVSLVVASKTDLIEDYSHIRSLGEALSSPK